MTERLVGRHGERARLEELLRRAGDGVGAIVLLGGEAGVGKTRLAAEVAAGADALVLRGSATQGATAPYGPLVAALRSRLRAQPDALAGAGPLRAELALLLPELGDRAAAADRPTLFEALRAAFAHVAAERPALVLLDDLQWSDEATLEVLSSLAVPVRELPLLVLAAYRSDGLPRRHGIRRLRNDLRRAGHLDELVLGPLGPEDTAALLAQALGAPPDPALARAIHERSEGIPFFAEELAAALRLSDAPQGEVPLPDTVRDAVLIGASELTAEGRAAADVAAVAGEAFAPELVAALSSDAGLTELLERGLVLESAAGVACFRHALAREALYADVPWIRRRALHRALAEALERAGAHGGEVAEHWLGARDAERARAALLRAASESEAVHAYRDAARAGRQALELWPAGEDGEGRAEILERYARCCQPAGDLAEAARAWRELVALHAAAHAEGAVAGAQRGLAAVLELAGDRDGAVLARAAAADAYAATGDLAAAAVERLAIANQRRLAARHGEAIELARAAKADAEAAGRLDLRIRALGLEGMARAKHGEYEAGLETVRGGLALALEHDLTAVAAELYQRLSVTLYDSADYRSAEAALGTALELCRASPDAGTQLACETCMAYVLRERGAWAPAAELSRELIARGSAVFVAEALLGTIQAYEGKLGSARRLLDVLARHRRAPAPLQHDRRHDVGARARRGRPRRPGRRGRALPRRPRPLGGKRRSPLRARRPALGGHVPRRPRRPGRCARLRRGAHADRGGDGPRGRARRTRARDRRDGAPRGRHGHRRRAADARRRAAPGPGHAVRARPDRAARRRRAGRGGRARGRARAPDRRLPHGAPARRAPAGLRGGARGRALGESVAARLGARAAAHADGSGLSRREREVVRLVAAGRTNREIAQGCS